MNSADVLDRRPEARPCVVFDLGSTLIDETRAQRGRFENLNVFLQKAGNPVLPIEQLFSFCERMASDFAPSPFFALVATLGLTPEANKHINESVLYPKHLEQLYPGVPNLLKNLSSRYQLGVLANQPRGTERRLRQFRIRHYFDFVLSSADFGMSKPTREFFESVHDLTGASKSAIIMVGDRLDNDVLPANSLGWTTVRVLQEFHRFQLPRTRGEIPDYQIKSIGQLDNLLKDIIG